VEQSRYGTAVRHIHMLFSAGTIGRLTDGQILERFTSCDEEAAEFAFAALVERHGPMVLRVCQSVLRERHDAEDAFQATFLILVRKAASIRKRNSVVSWLHGVAFRTASCHKAAKSRRGRLDHKAAAGAPASAESGDPDDLATVLHEELDGLPEKFRIPIVLCYFEGQSHEQAARQLSWPVGTVRSRLARGREQLRWRLTRRGLAPAIVLLERSLTAHTARAAISPALADATARAAVHCAAGRLVASGVTSTSVNLLIEGAMNAMFLAKIKLATLACGLIATGALVVAHQAGVVFPEAQAQATSADASEKRQAGGATRNDNDAVARELRQLDLELLAADVNQLKEQVESTLRAKLRAERENLAGSEDAQRDFKSARASYLAKARELRAAQRGRGSDLEPPGSSAEEPRDPVTARADHGATATEPVSHPGAAIIGTVDLDLVFKRYDKVKTSTKEYNAALSARKNDLMRIMAEAQEEAQMLSKFAPQSEDYKRHEDRVAELKARHEAGREQAQREFAQRQTESLNTHYQEIQQAVAALARAKGLTHVVKVTPGPNPAAQHADVLAALNSSVVYADPRNDLTEAVILKLNRRFREDKLQKPD
jgi:RNA polymerase sigma factor (sigma-70 family)